MPRPEINPDKLSPQDIVSACKYLKTVGMPEFHLDEIHHNEKAVETYQKSIGWFSPKGRFGSDTNRHYAARLQYIRQGREAGEQSFRKLVDEALKLWPKKSRR